MSYGTKYKGFVVMTLTSTSLLSFTLDPNVAVLPLTMCIHTSNLTGIYPYGSDHIHFYFL